MFDLGWLFWLLVVFLFAESWARVWATHQRGEKPRAAADDGDPCDSSALAG